MTGFLYKNDEVKEIKNYITSAGSALTQNSTNTVFADAKSNFRNILKQIDCLPVFYNHATDKNRLGAVITKYDDLKAYIAKYYINLDSDNTEEDENFDLNYGTLLTNFTCYNDSDHRDSDSPAQNLKNISYQDSDFGIKFTRFCKVVSQDYINKLFTDFTLYDVDDATNNFILNSDKRDVAVFLNQTATAQNISRFHKYDNTTLVEPSTINMTKDNIDIEYDMSNLSGANGTVIDSLVYNDELYIVGTFTEINGVSANRIAKYNFATGVWSTFGTGANGDVECIEIDPSGNIYIGGAFTQVNGVSANRIAKYNGTVWSSIGSSGDKVIKIRWNPTNSKLYAVGNFSTIGGVATKGFGEWNGTTWGASSSAFIGTFVGCNGVACIGTEIFFTHGTKVNRYNASTGVFDELAFTFSGGSPLKLFNKNGELFVSGSFTNVNGSPLAAVAKLDVMSATPYKLFDSNFNNMVYDFVLDTNGDCYITGSFNSINSTTFRRIAKYNYATSQWEQLSNGLSVLGRAIELYNNKIYIGGEFTFVGDTFIANRLAQYDLSTSQWSAISPSLITTEIPLCSNFKKSDLNNDSLEFTLNKTITYNLLSTPANVPYNNIKTVLDNGSGTQVVLTNRNYLPSGYNETDNYINDLSSFSDSDEIVLKLIVTQIPIQGEFELNISNVTIEILNDSIDLLPVFYNNPESENTFVILYPTNNVRFEMNIEDFKPKGIVYNFAHNNCIKGIYNVLNPLVTKQSNNYGGA